MLLAGIAEIERGTEAAADAMRSARVRERIRMDTNLTMLKAVAFSAPALGVLGTLLGIVSVMPHLALPLFSPQGLAGSAIREALGALAIAAAGLLVGIPAAMASLLFDRRVNLSEDRSLALMHLGLAAITRYGAEQKALEQKPAAQKATEEKPVEEKPAAQKAAEQKFPEHKPVASKPASPPAGDAVPVGSDEVRLAAAMPGPSIALPRPRLPAPRASPRRRCSSRFRLSAPSRRRIARKRLLARAKWLERTQSAQSITRMSLQSPVLENVKSWPWRRNPPPPEPEIVFPPSFHAPRRRRTKWQRLTVWLTGLGGFFALSSLFHLLGVGLIAIAPMQFTPRLQAEARRVPERINNVIEPSDANYSFDFIDPPPEGRIRQNDEITKRIAAELGIPQDGLVASKHSDSESRVKPPEAAAPPPSDPEASTAAATEAALATALTWIVRHQSPDGSWSLHEFDHQCRGGACGDAGTLHSNAAATGLALAPLVAAAERDRASADMFEQPIARGIAWLVAQQRPDGDLSGLGEQRMFSHALAGLALARRYSQTHDSGLGAAVQLAVNFSLAAQNTTTGGWDYESGGEGNTFSVAWQLMLAEAAANAGLTLDPECCRLADRWFKSVEKKNAKGLFAYDTTQDVSPAMTAVGLGYLRLRGVPAEHRAMREGHTYLLANPPDASFTRDVFYWHVATPVVKRFGDLEWQSWWQRLARGIVQRRIDERLQHRKLERGLRRERGLERVGRPALRDLLGRAAFADQRGRGARVGAAALAARREHKESGACPGRGGAPTNHQVRQIAK